MLEYTLYKAYQALFTFLTVKLGIINLPHFLSIIVILSLKKVKEKLRLYNQSFVHDLKCLVVRFLLNRFQSLDLILHKYKV